jgi:hypothetical protein
MPFGYGGMYTGGFETRPYNVRCAVPFGWGDM